MNTTLKTTQDCKKKFTSIAAVQPWRNTDSGKEFEHLILREAKAKNQYEGGVCSLRRTSKAIDILGY